MTTGITTAGVTSAALVVRIPDLVRAMEPVRPRERSDDDRPTTIPCRCGHAVEAHEHYRPGSDCGACGAQGCRRFRPQRGRRWWPRMRR
jgi:hypothetical protein